jgi:hypothetical protein
VAAVGGITSNLSLAGKAPTFVELTLFPRDGGKVSRQGGTGWDASEATRLVRAVLSATPTTRMAPSRSNFPYPAPITGIEARPPGDRLSGQRSATPSESF